MPLLETLTERTAPLVAPIAGGAGADVTFEPDFEKLKKEIDKLSSVDQKPDWKIVNSGAAVILKDKSKDFRVAIWNAVALLQAKGFEGFAEGLVVLKNLVDNFWDTMFPDVKRGRARANLVGWLVDQAVKVLEKSDVNRGNGEAVKLCDDTLQSIDSTFAEKLGDVYSGLGQLKNLMRDKVRQIPPEPTAAAEGTTEAAPVEAAAGPQAPVVTGMGDVDAAFEFHGTALVAVGHVLRAEDSTNALAYRCVRMGAWLPCRIVPPNENGVTMIPSSGDPNALQAMIEGQQFLEVVNAVEGEIPTNPFRFDLQRYCALALDGLGPTHAAARETLGRELVAFLMRNKGVERLLYSDNVPFADNTTRAWLEEEVGKYGGGGGKGPSKAQLAVDAEEQEIKARFEEARSMVLAGSVIEGLQLGIALSMRGGDARGRFRSRLLVAQMALEGNKRDLAKPMLEALVSDVEAHHLETWEPALCIPVYSSLLACLRGGRTPETSVAPEQLTREEYLFDKLCRLDPAAAVKATS
jgi:type VI secretion system protein VasJ